MYKELLTPAVIVDLDTVERNIERMANKLSKFGIAHRPHIKTHKTVKFAKMQLNKGAIGITVAKLTEAEVFIESGIKDILIAFPIVGEDKLEIFSKLLKQANIITTVDSLEAALGLSRVGEQTGKTVKVLIEIDGGLHRGGRQPGSDTIKFVREIKGLPGIEIVGIMAYFGKIYSNNNQNDLIEAVKQESLIANKVSKDLESEGINVKIISTGSSPSSSNCQYLENVTEVRAGNYIFYDVSAIDLGIAEEKDCALRVIATVVSTPIPGMATIDAGTKTLTSDKSHHRNGFGIVVGHPEITITSLNEEHGFLNFDPTITSLSVGDRIEIIPNHSCVIPNLCDELAGVRNGEVVEFIPVDARGKNK
ncbi:alanine racemase [Bacillus salipaludis]|uniref:Alanine racemase n=1 Tax=Bacillus salipaludis TaxID=2547811 RepID=A0ABW8RMC6_9BACI